MSQECLSREETLPRTSQCTRTPSDREEHPDPVNEDALSSCSWGENAILLSYLLFIGGIEEAENIEIHSLQICPGDLLCAGLPDSMAFTAQQGRGTRNKQLHV